MMGILHTGIILHESIHVLQAEKPLSICYDFGTTAIMKVYGEYDADVPRYYFEEVAYSIQSFFMLLIPFVFGCIIGYGIKIFKKN